MLVCKLHTSASPRRDVPAVFRAAAAFLSRSSSSRLPLEAASATQGDSLSVRKSRSALENHDLAPMLVGITVCSPTRTTACFRRPGCFQGHGCVPLDELFLTAPTGGRIGDPRRLALRKEIAFRSRKPRPCAYASWDHRVFSHAYHRVFPTSRLFSGPRMRSSRRALRSSLRLPLEAAPPTQADSLSVREHSRSS